jgi:hypothetical protein
VLRESLELATAAGLDGLGEQVLDVAAALAAMRGSATRAARFAGAAQASMRKAGRRRQPVDEAFVAGPLEMARAAVGEAAFDAARASGQALCYDEALAEVRAWLERGDEERA